MSNKSNNNKTIIELIMELKHTDPIKFNNIEILLGQEFGRIFDLSLQMKGKNGVIAAELELGQHSKNTHQERLKQKLEHLVGDKQRPR